MADELVTITVRRLGSHATHRATVPEQTLKAKRIFTTPVEVVTAPVVTHCQAVLRGTVVRMSMSVAVSCAKCARGVR